MINYVWIFFLPGSAGNFLSRCVNLLSDQCYCWVDSTTQQLNLSLEEKFKLFDYSRSYKFTHWGNYEDSLTMYHKIMSHHDLPESSYSIWQGHPNYKHLSNGIAGTDDREFVFYIDPQEQFEWIMLNCLKKDSFIQCHDLVNGQQMLQDQNVHKLSISNIITAPETLLYEIQKISNLIGLTLQDDSKKYITKLWHQWNATTIKHDQFQTFKKKIGFYY
jgi:hypothetical protein